MRLLDDIHLCYCFNNLDVSEFDLNQPKFLKIADKVRAFTGIPPTANFALGLWINEALLSYLEKASATKKLFDMLREKNFYVFTLNVFPYGAFHGSRIKEKVYLPDWRTEERLLYTCRAAKLLSKILPDELEGSLSTCPGAYNNPPIKKEDILIIAKNLAKTAKCLEQIYLETGKKIMLGVEPEPDCLWEDSAEFAKFFTEQLAELPECAKHIGVCHDCSHHELTGKKPAESLLSAKSAGMQISKIQLSAAISAPTAKSKEVLAKFADETYLHQTCAFSTEDNKIYRYSDLPLALQFADKSLPWFIHYHIPIYLENLPCGLKIEKTELEKILELLKNKQIKCKHLEIETYTFPVLPENIKDISLEESMAREYQFVFSKFTNKFDFER